MQPDGATALFSMDDFIIDPRMVYLASGAEGLFLKQHLDALTAYAHDKGRAWLGRRDQERIVSEARRKVARLFGVAEGDIGFVSNVAEGISLLAESLDWRPTDNIVVDSIDFPSVVMPFSISRKFRDLRIARGSDPNRFHNLVDRHTRVIAVSHVSYLTGERLDLAALRSLADECQALLIVDFSQSVGVVPVETSLCDFAFSACYKFMLGCPGAAVAYWNRTRQPEWTPSTAGWYSVVLPPLPDYEKPPPLKADAGRFSRGNVAYPVLYMLSNALDYLAQVDSAVLLHHVQELADALVQGLDNLGIPIMTPRAHERRGPNISFECTETDQLVARLYDKQVVVSPGSGRVRFSFHGYNTLADVTRALDVLESEWQG